MRPAPYGRRLLLAIMTVAAGLWTGSAHAEPELGVACVNGRGAGDGDTALMLADDIIRLLRKAGGRK